MTLTGCEHNFSKHRTIFKNVVPPVFPFGVCAAVSTCQAMLESKHLKTFDYGCVSLLIARIKLGEKQYMDAFNDELNSFRDRIRGRAKARIEEAIKEYEEVCTFIHEFVL